MATLLRRRRFTQLVGSVSIDALASWITQMLLITLIGLGKHGSMITYSGGALIIGLPPILLAPWSGVLVDRWNHRLTLAISEVAKGLLLITAVVLFIPTGSFTPVWAALFLFYAADVFKNSSAPAILPHIVPAEELVSANSLWYTFHRTATFIGMAGGGWLIGLAGWQASSLLCGVLLIGASLLVFNMRAFAVPRPALGPDGKPERFLAQIKEVVIQIGRNRYVAFVMFSIFISFSISAIAYTVLLYLLQHVLKLSSGGVSLYLGILALGMLFGAIISGVVGRRLRQADIVIFSCAAIGVLFLIGPWVLNSWFVGVFALIAGVGFSWIRIAQTIILQVQVPPEIQGRIFATREFFSNVSFLLVTSIIGLLSMVTVLKLLLILIGLALLAFAVFGIWMTRGLDDRILSSGTDTTDEHG